MSKKIKVMSVFGTRPEAIKMAPLVLETKKQSRYFESVVVVTAQHREMLDQVLTTFDIQPDYDLNIMKKGQSLTEITSEVLLNLDEIIQKETPDIVLVHGDTTTAYAASLSAFYNKVSVGHVEAGLRTWNKYSPYPEEMNRQLIDVIADEYYAPTEAAKENLIREGKPEGKIFVTGNTVIDALNKTVVKNYSHSVLDKINSENRIILLTMHRRENLGEPMKAVFNAINNIVKEFNDVEVVYPLHMNPDIREIANKEFCGNSRVHLIEPLEVMDFHNIAAKSHIILTDSGGIQEEAPSLGKPVLVLRDTTERPEGVDAGTLKLIGTSFESVINNTRELLNNKKLYLSMSEAKNPYGDGEASKKILEAIRKSIKK